MYGFGVERDYIIIGVGIASGVLDFQNSDSLIHHCINHSRLFPYAERGWENICALL